MTPFRLGDVVQYRSERDNSWCREGLAVVQEGRNGLILVDTYWNCGGRYGQDDHVLTEVERATAEVVFNLNDYREIATRSEWVQYHPTQRQTVTAQHRLQAAYYVQTDAKPDMATKIENAREAVVEAERAVECAERSLRWCRDDLARLLEPSSEGSPAPLLAIGTGGDR